MKYLVSVCRTWACYDPETGASRSGHVCFTEPIECVRSYIERGGEKYLLLKAIGELFSERCVKKCKAFKSVIRNVIPQSILMCDYDDVSLLPRYRSPTKEGNVITGVCLFTEGRG